MDMFMKTVPFRAYGAVERDIEQLSARKTHSKLWWGVDLVLIAIVLIPVLIFEFGHIPVNKAGFHCKDPKLSFPFKGETVTGGMLFAVLFILPLIVFHITEYLVSETPRKTLQVLKNACWLTRSYFLGFFIHIAILDLMKGIFGEPRPIFFDVCKPDTLLTCNGTEYVNSFKCTSSYGWWSQMDSSRSFPSGHTSLSVYCALFLVWYLQMRAFNWHGRSVALVPVVQVCILSLSVVASLSRIRDHVHHWWDVLAGSVLGFSIFFYAVFCLCNNFATHNDRRTEKSQDEEIPGQQTLLQVYH